MVQARKLWRKHKVEPYPLEDSTHRYWRDWCLDCGEPIRVSKKNVNMSLCQDCDGRKKETVDITEHLTPRQRIGYAKVLGTGMYDDNADDNNTSNMYGQ